MKMYQIVIKKDGKEHCSVPVNLQKGLLAQKAFVAKGENVRLVPVGHLDSDEAADDIISVLKEVK